MLLVGVISSQATSKHGDAVMETWGGEFLTGGHGDLIVFDSSPMHRVREGHKLHLSTTDDYAHNTWRFTEFLCYALETINPEYIFNCCDDTYVAVDRLASFDYKSADYIGQPCMGYCNESPPYASGGGGFFLSNRAARTLISDAGFRASSGTMPSITDQLVGNCLRRNNMALTPSHRFYSQPDKQPLPGNDLITCHYQHPDLMRSTHAAYKRFNACQ